MLFIDFTAARPSRLRVNGVARIDEDDALTASYPGAQFVVRVRATQVFPNCPRYIHRMALVRALAVRAARRPRDADSRLEAGRVGVRRPPGR